MKRLICQVLICLLLIIPLACQSNYHLVTRVIDGDTIVLENGEKVRLIGIDTFPTREGAELIRAVKKTGLDKESIKALGRRASEFTKGLCKGKTVRLEYDQTRRDYFGRLLAYVYVDGVFVNAYLLENGFAEIMTVKPNVRYRELLNSVLITHE